MIRTLMRWLSRWWDLKALSRGPGAYGKRQARKHAYRKVRRWMP